MIHHIKILKNNNHVIDSTEAEKAVDKVQHSNTVKTLNKVGIEGAIHYIIKAICEKPNARIIMNGKRVEVFPLRSGTRHDVHYCHCYLM